MPDFQHLLRRRFFRRLLLMMPTMNVCHVAKRDSSPEKFLFEVSFTPGKKQGIFAFLSVKTPLYLSLRRSASQRRPISLFWYTYIAHKYDVTFLYDAYGAFIILFSRSRVWLSPSRTKNSKVASIFPRRRRRMPLWQKSRGDNETNKVCILRTFLKHKLFNFVFCARL